MDSQSDSSIEIVRPDALRRATILHALFDFDGTLSLIRQGWQDVMVPLMVEVLRATPRHEPVGELESVVREFVTRTTGKQTIYQMIGLRDMVLERGGKPLDALEYKRIYLERLWARIRGRVERLDRGEALPRDLMVPGAEDILECLTDLGVTCYLASGTDVPYVVREAEVLGLARYFGGRIYGALENWQDYSKAMVIERILRENRLNGYELVTFGDGFVEIEETVKAGGIAVGVASDEERRGGLVDAWKRDRLIQAGAQVIVPDFGEHQALLAVLCGDDWHGRGDLSDGATRSA